MRLSYLVVLAAASLGACRARPSHVPVIASPESLEALAGEWTGEFTNLVTRRGGSIVLRIRAGQDTAHGDVLLEPRGGTPVLANAGPTRVVVPTTALTLQIAFVRAVGDTVSGRMQPYESPDCACTLTTTFVGRLRGDRIEGTYTAVGAPGGPQSGRWQAKRRR